MVTELQSCNENGANFYSGRGVLRPESPLTSALNALTVNGKHAFLEAMCSSKVLKARRG